MKWGHLLAALSAVALLSCGGDGSPSEPGNGGTGPTVAVVNNSFTPGTLEVSLNGTVTWQWNSGGIEHNVTFAAGPSSGNRTSGSFSRAFTAAGSIAYACTIHAAEGMTGVVNVAGATGGGGDGGGGGGDGGGGGYP